MAKRIVILIFDGFLLSGLSEIAEIFCIANATPAVERLAELPGAEASVSGTSVSGTSISGTSATGAAAFEAHTRVAAYALSVLSGTGGSVASSCSMRVLSDALDVHSLAGCAALFVVGGPGVAAACRDAALIRCLRAAVADAQIVRAVGSGSEILAAAGFGDEGRLGFAADPATASGQAVTPDDPFGPIAAALTVVKRDYGTAAAREVSDRSLPDAWRRLRAVLGDVGDGSWHDKVSAALRWLAENFRRPVTIGEAARAVSMSERSFLRHFKVLVGLTPSEYLLRMRLEASCALLASTDLTIDEVARRCGIGSGDRLAKMFRHRLLVSPSEYRASMRR